jgi:hypothetical protein
MAATAQNAVEPFAQGINETLFGGAGAELPVAKKAGAGAPVLFGGGEGEDVGGTQYIVMGDVNVGLRPDIPGGVDVNAAIETTRRVDYSQVR